MKHLWLFFLVISIAFISCANDDEATINKLSGTWIWTMSQGGFGGWTLTPETEGYTYKIEFDEYYYQKYLNDSLVMKLPFTVELSEETLFGTESHEYIYLENYLQLAIELNSNELLLIEQCFDCFQHSYKKE